MNSMNSMNSTNSELSPSLLFGGLPILKLRFDIQIAKNSYLPPFLGSAWRGLIGWELQRLICPFSRRPLCKECTIKLHCPYFVLFEDESTRTGLQEIPRGYIFYPPISKSDHRDCIYITLIGRCVNFLPVIVKAIFSGQKSGIGINRIPYKIQSWSQLMPNHEAKEFPINSDCGSSIEPAHPFREWLETYPKNSNKISINLTTPVRLRKKGQYLNIMEWPFFFGTLARRLEALNCVYNQGESFGKETWIKLIQQFAAIGEIKADLTWDDYARYSSHQKRKVPMGGLIGQAVIHSPNEWLSQWLYAANLLHVGKGASMGLGRIEIF